MFRTRNSYKRSSSSDVNESKKKRLSNDNKVDKSSDESEDLDDTDADSDFKLNGVSSSESDESESKYFKQDKQNVSKNSLKLKSTPKKILPTTSKGQSSQNKFVGRHLDSDSSSDEFEKVPFSLDDLGDFQKIEMKKTESLKSSDSEDVTQHDSNGQNGNDSSQYYDFTQIMERQELYKSVSLKSNENDKLASLNKSTPSKVQSELNNKIRSKKNCSKLKSPDKKSNHLDVMDLLKLGEGNGDEMDTSYDNEEGEIENEVKTKDIQVTIELPGFENKKEKKKTDIAASIKRRFNLIKKQHQVFAHKVHVLCLIAHGRYLNNVINSQDLMGIALSLIPAKHCYPPKRCDLNYLENLVAWFVGKVKIVDTGISNTTDLVTLLEKQFTNKIAYSKKQLVLMFVCMVRALGLTARLLVNLRPVPLKPPINELCVINNQPDKNSETEKTTVKSESSSKNDDKRNSTSKTVKSESSSKNDGKKNIISKKTETSSKNDGKKNSTSKYFDKTKNDNNDSNNKASGKKNVVVKSKYFKNESNGKAGKSSKSLEKNTLDLPGTSKENTTSKRPRRSTTNKKIVEQNSSDSDDDDVFESKPRKNSKKKIVKEEKLDRSIHSGDEKDIKIKSTGRVIATVNEWAEVFLEAEEKWISVDVVHAKIHCTQNLYSGSAQPVTYVLGWENLGYIKDLTRRYVPHWMTVTRKLRAESDWWDETINPYLSPNNARNREEDEELDKQLEDQSLPTAIGDFKNHPLYALKRHLLKFQAIYPPDAPTVGFIRKEPVFSRMCVVELHTRETWIKQAKLVQPGEEPYKIVKARPKYDKMSGTLIKDLPLNLFGYWQVKDYVPPPVVDGKVPRNEYGNIELYKPCMLPAGGVHLQLPGLNRVARKLNIDCAPAVVGWEFHSGGSHPILDGFVVGDEFKDVLLEAWNKEIDESAKRAREKIEQRVYGNWRRIIKGLLIREKLKLRYGFEDVQEETQEKKKRPTCKRRTKK